MTSKGAKIGKAASTGWIVSWDDVKRDIKKDVHKVQSFFAFNGDKGKYVRQKPLKTGRKR